MRVFLGGGVLRGKGAGVISLFYHKHIMLTRPCDLYPITPHFYIVKLGFIRVYIFSYFYTPRKRSLGGYTVFSLSVFLSFRLSVFPSLSFRHHFKVFPL